MTPGQISLAARPVCIGGIGGGGTRIFADLLLRCGLYLGSDLNEAHDNLWFTLLFKRASVLVETPAALARLIDGFLEKMATGRFPPELAGVALALSRRDEPQHGREWLAGRHETLLADHAQQAGRRIGWKEPNAHVIADRLLASVPGLAYVHVVRNPFDMIFSGNVNQHLLWSGIFLNTPGEPTLERKFRYWCLTQARVETLALEFPDRVHIVDYAQMVRDPEAAASALTKALDIELSVSVLRGFAASIQSEGATGRWRGRDLSALSPDDLGFARARGYFPEMPE
ncbi:MAG: sulfotransferase [Rhizobiaceae bacterium]|nr:sulfotransferase [Rhizobiaceae bacterium]